MLSPAIHADGSGVAGRVVARVLERFPRALQEQPLLRVHQLGFPRAEAEEARVEVSDADGHRGRRDPSLIMASAGWSPAANSRAWTAG